MVGSVGAALLAAMAKKAGEQRDSVAQDGRPVDAPTAERPSTAVATDSEVQKKGGRPFHRTLARQEEIRQIPVTYVTPKNLVSDQVGQDRQLQRPRLSLPSGKSERHAPGSQHSKQSNRPSAGVKASQDRIRFDTEFERPPSRRPRTAQTFPPPVAAAPVHQPSPSYELRFGRNARARTDSTLPKVMKLLPDADFNTSEAQVLAGTKTDEREVTIGLDFGTSCVKVVVGDPALGKAFAVPWIEASGVDRYLLPSRLYETLGICSLASGEVVHRDLKLALIADPQDAERQRKVVAFLALVVRGARNWLLRAHRDIYADTHVLWRLTVGLPTAQTLETDLTALCRRLGQSAWWLSRLQGEVTLQKASEALAHASSASDEVDVTVVPEIAAQIYGFVVSTGFDRAAANIFLMADIGSGTVDSALFRVRPASGGRWDFEFFTSIVEPNGVSNLHRHRIDWWKSVLAQDPKGAEIATALDRGKHATDLGTACPKSFQDYVHDVQVTISEKGASPDASFFTQRVVAQVQGRSFWRAWKDGFLPKANLDKVPFFMCGGGGRMELYQELESKLEKIPGVTWLSAVPHWLTVPNDLVAADVRQDGYDRLSVAYGLSKMEVGKVVRALPMPAIPTETAQSWREHYVDKDQC